MLGMVNPQCTQMEHITSICSMNQQMIPKSEQIQIWKFCGVFGSTYRYPRWAATKKGLKMAAATITKTPTNCGYDLQTWDSKQQTSCLCKMLKRILFFWDAKTLWKPCAFLPFCCSRCVGATKSKLHAFGSVCHWIGAQKASLATRPRHGQGSFFISGKVQHRYPSSSILSCLSSFDDFGLGMKVKTCQNPWELIPSGRQLCQWSEAPQKTPTLPVINWHRRQHQPNRRGDNWGTKNWMIADLYLRWQFI